MSSVHQTATHRTSELLKANHAVNIPMVVESPVSEQRMRDMFEAMDQVLRTHPEVGEYNQKI